MKTVKKGRIESIKNRFKEIFTKHKPVTKQDWIRLVVLAIAIPVFLYSSTKLVMQIYTYVSEDNKNQQIIDLKPSESKNPFSEIEPSDIVSTIETDKFPYQIILGKDSYLNEHGRLAEYENLWQKNNDMVGWFYFPGTPRRDINYPLLQAQDNIYYLNYDFNKNRSFSGSIYMDYRNNSYSNNTLNIDKNYIITGLAMRDMSMFGSISGYWHNENSQKNARYIYVDLLNTKLQYEVFSAFAVYPNYNYKQVNFADDQEYLDYLNDMVAKSSVDYGIEVGVDDRIVTLETCYLSERRTVIVGRLIRQIIYEIPEFETGEDNDLISRIEESEAPSEKPSVTPVVLPTDIPVNIPFPTATPPAEDRNAAKTVIDLIDLIIFPVTIESKPGILQARTEYNKLTNSQKSLVENYKALTDAEAELKIIENGLVAKEVSDLIKSIPVVDSITIENKEQIFEARNRYNVLTDTQKELIKLEEKDKLIAAVAKINKLEVDEVNGLIDEISQIEEISIEHSEQILLVQLKYDELDVEQKTQVIGVETLKTAFMQIMVLEVNKLISEIPEIEDITLENEEQILTANKKYENLNADQKLQILNSDKLKQAVDKIDSLKPTPTPTGSTDPTPEPTGEPTGEPTPEPTVGTEPTPA